MNKTAKQKSVVISHADLLAHRSARVTASFGDLHVSYLNQIADFNSFNEYFRTDHFTVILITNGSVNASVNFQPFSLTGNSLAVTGPNALRKMVNATASAEGMAVTFTSHFLAEAGITKRSLDLLSFFGSHGIPHWQLHQDDTQVILRLMEDLFRRCKHATSHLYGKEQLYHSFAIFLYELAAQNAKHAELPIQKLSRKEDIVMQFADLVNKHLREQRKVQFYASLLHVTPKYLTETVKEITGKNAGEIIDDFVLVECKLLLENPAYSIAQISSFMNFADPSFFGKYFKRLTGLSPKEFRIKLII